MPPPVAPKEKIVPLMIQVELADSGAIRVGTNVPGLSPITVVNILLDATKTLAVGMLQQEQKPKSDLIVPSMAVPPVLPR
jgi:hypothetical protein